MNDHYREWDAAYVFGALAPAERREYELHLAGCAQCSAAVGELAALPGLLSLVPARDVPDRPADQPAPASLLPCLVAAARIRRTRVRGALAAGVTATLLALLAVVLPGVIANDGPIEHTITLAQVTASGMSAEVSFTENEWGTDIRVRCDYEQGTPNYAGYDYALYLTEADGSETRVATWTARPGSTVTPTASTRLGIDDIRSVEVRAIDSGAVLLRGSP